jgi:hypothetical protein
MSWSPCAEFGNGGAIPASCLSGPFLVSRFCCVPSTRLVVPRVESIWNRGPVGSTSLPRGRGRIDPKSTSPAGGDSGACTLARIMAQHLNISLGHPVVIENVTGAAGAIAVGRVARAAPDGYTLGIGNWGTHVINAVMALPYDPVKDFEPVALIAGAAHGLPLKLWPAHAPQDQSIQSNTGKVA